MNSKAEHLYFHVPFCDGKCSYCAFYSTLFSKQKAETWLLSIENELQETQASFNLKPTTIYLGGGTPSLLPTKYLVRFLKLISEHSDISQVREWTIEGNPGTFDKEKIAVLADFSVNRVSIGAQSFDNKILKQTGRRHDSDATVSTIKKLKSAGFENIGIDLIACLPGSNPSFWENDLRTAISLEPEHISIYALTIEAPSQLHSFLLKKHTEIPFESDMLDALELAEQMLSSSGYWRYEISNYAKPGFEALHNMAYWKGKDFIGFGPAASSRIGQIRKKNADDLNYTKLPPEEKETLSNKEDLVERFIFQIRLTEGVDIESFCTKHNCLTNVRTHWLNTFKELSENKIVERNGSRWRLTKRGIQVADTVCELLLP